MQQPERLTRRDHAKGFAIGLVCVLFGVFALDGLWAVSMVAVGVSFWIEALVRVWRRRGSGGS
jgi:hypothetical protein